MSRPRPEDLRGEALRMFETWRSLGLNEAHAMREVTEAGLVAADPGDELAGVFTAMGESAHTARLAATGRGTGEGWAPPSVGRRGRMRSAWSWQVDEPPAPATAEAESAAGRPAHDAALVDMYERATRAVQQSAGLSADQAAALVRRRMAEACGMVVSEATASGGRRS